MTRDEIVQQAMALSPEDRAYIVAALEVDFSQETERVATDEGNTALLLELKRRSAAYHTGKTSGRPASDVIDDLRKLASGE